MRRFYHTLIPAALTAAALTTGCIKESLEPCPENEARIRLRVENFGSDQPEPVMDYEPAFGARIGSLRYALYSGDVLLWERHMDNLSGTTDPMQHLPLGRLDFGDYRLSVSANVPPDRYASSAGDPDNYAVVYRGPDKTADYFSADIPFTVDCDCSQVFDGTLRRMHSVVRTTLYNVPADIASVRISISNVSERKLLAGDYDGVTSASLDYPIDHVRRDTTRMVTGVFPTAPDAGRSGYDIRLFDPEGKQVYEKTVADTLLLKRNRLTDVAVRFPENPADEIKFEITVDTRWDGHENGGSAEID